MINKHAVVQDAELQNSHKGGCQHYSKMHLAGQQALKDDNWSRTFVQTNI